LLWLAVTKTMAAKEKATQVRQEAVKQPNSEADE
jgi:hypothetical protein